MTDDLATLPRETCKNEVSPLLSNLQLFWQTSYPVRTR